jgi:hypothetical protein
LIRHKRIHSGIKPYACRICPKTFSSSSNLKQHNNVHKNIIKRKKFCCFIKNCTKSYLYICTLKKHVSLVHQEYYDILREKYEEINFNEIYKDLKSNKNYDFVEFKNPAEYDEPEPEEEINQNENQNSKFGDLIKCEKNNSFLGLKTERNSDTRGSSQNILTSISNKSNPNEKTRKLFQTVKNVLPTNINTNDHKTNNNNLRYNDEKTNGTSRDISQVINEDIYPNNNNNVNSNMTNINSNNCVFNIDNHQIGKNQSQQNLNEMIKNYLLTKIQNNYNNVCNIDNFGANGGMITGNGNNFGPNNIFQSINNLNIFNNVYSQYFNNNNMSNINQYPYQYQCTPSNQFNFGNYGNYNNQLLYSFYNRNSNNNIAGNSFSSSLNMNLPTNK